MIGRGPGDEEVGDGVFPVGSRTEVRAREAVKGSDGRRYRRWWWHMDG